MKDFFIFLDVDGVLNTDETPCTIPCFRDMRAGIDEELVNNLNEFVNILKSKFTVHIILTSTWNEEWFKDNKEKQDIFANILDAALAKHNLIIEDSIPQPPYGLRGKAIIEWVINHNISFNNVVVIDDDTFDCKDVPDDIFLWCRNGLTKLSMWSWLEKRKLI